MRMSNSEFNSFVNSILPDASAEDLQYSVLCGMIGAEIVMKRREMGMSQKQFAEFMGVSQGLVSRWEHGETNFTLETLVNIASKLGLEMQSPIKPTPAKVPYLSKGKVVCLSPKKNWSAQSYSESSGYTEFDEFKEM